MNKNLRVITINGFRGILMVVFIISGLIAGFIISPAWVCMKLWNLYIREHFSLMPMNIWQGLLLWAVIALSFYAINNKRLLINLGSYHGLSKEQIKDVIKKAKMSDSSILCELETLKNKVHAEEEAKKAAESEQKQEDEQKEEIRGGL